MSDEIRSDQSPTIGKLAAALSRAQAEMPPANQDCYNTFYGSGYASLSSCWDACQGPLAANELAVVQTGGPPPPEFVTHLVHMEADEKHPAREKIVVHIRLELVTTLIHSSGEWIRGSISAVVDGSGPDAVAAVSYLRRAGLCAIVGLSVAETAKPDQRPAPPRERSKAAPAQRPSARTEPNRFRPPLPVDEPFDESPTAASPPEADGAPWPEDDGEAAPPPPADGEPTSDGPKPQDIHDQGEGLYGEKGWVERRSAAAEWASGERTQLINHLTDEELEKLAEELERRKNDPEGPN